MCPNRSSPTAPTIFTVAEPACSASFDRESFAQATAWFAPFPPELTWNEFADKVSPALGTREVKVVRSTLREPTMVMIGSGDAESVVCMVVEDRNARVVVSFVVLWYSVVCRLIGGFR